MRGSVASSIVLVCVGVFYLACALRYDIGRLSDPRPGFFPAIVGLVFVLCSVSLLVVAVRSGEGRYPETTREALGIRQLLPGILVLGGMVLYVLVVEYVGFLLASAALLMFLMWIGGARNWLVNAVLGVGTSGLLYWFFWVVMRVPIPRGTLWGG